LDTNRIGPAWDIKKTLITQQVPRNLE